MSWPQFLPRTQPADGGAIKADLLDRYGLALSELELRHQPCDGFGIDTGRKRAGPLDDIVPTIAEFCDCRCWLETTPDKLQCHQVSRFARFWR